MTIAVYWDVKHQNKQTNNNFRTVFIITDIVKLIMHGTSNDSLNQKSKLIQWDKYMY